MDDSAGSEDPEDEEEYEGDTKEHDDEGGGTLAHAPVTAFTSAAMVGTGRGVGVVGGGTGRSSLQKIVTWNMCQQNINLKLWKMTRLIFWWRFPMQLLLSAFITVPI